MTYLKKYIPESFKLTYHRVRSYTAALINGFPARSMTIVGVTGTKGKTSTLNYIWSVVHAGGYKAGLVSSANFRIDQVEEANPYHMTMPDPFVIQKKLHEMKKHGVQVVAIEMTSEGMKQYRHSGIPVDIAVFTNLTPEHLKSHKNDFEVYKKAKSKLFTALASKPKNLAGRVTPRTIIANADSEHSEYYLSFPADQKITFGLQKGDLRAENVVAKNTGVFFDITGSAFELSIPGTFNVYNALPAIAVAQVLSISLACVKTGLKELTCIPGRMERIEEGQDFTVIVDYAHEPASLGALLSSAQDMLPVGNSIILLIGVIGGGRESRVPLARLAAQNAHTLIITNEDPYEEDPGRMIKELADTALMEGKKMNKDLFTYSEREDAIKKALSIAKRGDIVLITGKGAEQTMMTKDGAIPWNERNIVRTLTRAQITK